jgi:excisionase family DNA binding protein
MALSWDDEYLTVNEIAEHLKLNPQTIRNWIEVGSLPAVRVGRRVRIRRADLDRLLAQGTTATAQPQPATATTATTGTPAEAVEQLSDALERARRLLGRRSATRRAELAEALQDLTDAVATALQTLSDDVGHPDPQ